MCGIAGLVDLAGLDGTAARERMRAALDRLAPRGPDGEGEWGDARCLFGHRRLAIVDLSPAGAQPMIRHGLALVFNGMIYNYRALRIELAALGHRFASDSDTEVLLAGWRQWGEGLLPKLAGMFAFAIWDAGERRLVLARDRFGKKPLIYRRDGRRLAFASDLVAAEKLAGGDGAIDPAALGWLFTLRYIPEPRTALAGFAKLPAGHVATLSEDGFALRRWYDPAAAPKPHLGDEANAARVLRDRIETAVADRLVADVAVGAFLSGGIDSAIVVAAMAKASSRVRTYTVGFEGVPDYYEERPAARQVADFLGTEHTEIAVTPAEALGAVEKVFDGLDEPFADSSAIPTFLVARATRRHVTVALSGDGGDEVFGGYRKYQGELLAERYRAVPAALRHGVIEPLARLLPEGKSHPLLERARRLRRFVAHAGAGGAARQAGWMRLLPPDELAALLGAGAAVPLEAEIESLRRAAGDTDEVNRMLHADIALGLPGDMLTKADRMSMANSLEVRCPLLDHRVVEAAAAMPGAWKLKRGEGKAVLRRAFADALPAEVFQRPKKGFEIPIALWLKGPLRALVETALDAQTLESHGIAPGVPRRWLAELDGGRRDTSEKLWTLVAFTQWAARRGAAAQVSLAGAA